MILKEKVFRSFVSYSKREPYFVTGNGNGRLLRGSRKGETDMANVIVITIIAVAVFFIVRSELKKLSRGQCSGGCPGCNGSCGSCAGTSVRKEER